MRADVELIRSVYKNAEMGKETIPAVWELAESEGLKQALQQQLQEYCQLSRASRLLLQRRGRRVCGPSPLTAAMARSSLRVKTLTNRSASHLAEMMIQGSTMGSIQITRRLHRFRDTADREAMQLAKRLLETEENNIRQMKRFL